MIISKITLKCAGALVLASLVSVASAQTIPEAIDDILDRASTVDLDMGVLIENEDGSIQYYSKNPDTVMTPASNQKILTTAVAFGLLGENHAFTTTIYYTGTFSSGNISGDLIILGEHDPTWNTSTLTQADDALDIIAQKVVDAGVTSISGDVRGFGAMSYGRGGTNTGHNSISATASENLNATDRFLLELTSRGITVSGSATGEVGFTPPGGSTMLVDYLSTESNYRFGGPLDLAEACIPLNKVSHNVMADYLLRHIGYEQSGSDTYTAGETQSLAWLSGTAGLDTTNMDIVDGSGLSRFNKVSARQLVDITRYMTNNFPNWVTTLPISGTDGTIGSRLTAITGDVLAKTGTLPSSGAVSLSGLINSDTDGQRYFFSWMENTEGLTGGGTQSIDTTNGRDVIDDSLVEFVFSYPPVSVDTRSVTEVNSTTVRVEWDDNALVGDSYTVQKGELGSSFTDVATVTTAYIIEAGNDNDSDGLNNSDYSDTGAFTNSSSHSAATGLTSGVGSRFIVPTSGNGTATFTPSNLPEGRYRVDVSCFDFSSADANNTEVQITDLINNPTPSSAFFDLSEDTAGDTWRSIGTINFVPGQGHKVDLLNNAQTSTGSNDRMNPAAVRFVPLFAEISKPASEGIKEYRVVVNGPRGLASEVSETFSFSDGSSANKALVIDGYDRWNTIVDNSDRDSHTFAAITAQDINDISSGLKIETASNEAVLDGDIDLDDYEGVFWVLGEESTADETFSSLEQTIVTNYLTDADTTGDPKNLFVSGSEIGWDLDRDSGPSTADRAFMNNILRADLGGNANDDSQTYNFVYQSNSVVSGGLLSAVTGTQTYDNGTGPIYDVSFPDILTPQNGSQAILSYSGGLGGTAAIGYDGSGTNEGKLIFMGFGYETILSQTARQNLMTDTLDFFGLLSTASIDGWMIFGE